jgi:hypothetical protein
VIGAETNPWASEPSPGRSCPLHYRYQPEVFASEAPEHLQSLQVLYVVGGLYGNELALQRVLELFEQEHGRKRLIFNGDFHWFDADTATFARVQRAVLAHQATRGNVETELAETDDGGPAGCGCAYPSWVGDDVVERSNQILARIKRSTTAAQRAELAALPMWLRADVGGLRLGIVHGDATSLAGWGFAQEHLRSAAHRAVAATWLDRAQVDAFACSHTCLPVFRRLPAPVGSGSGASARWVLNNGSAGMPNFEGDPAGLLTRISTEPSRGPARLGAVSLGSGVQAEAIAINFDATAWRSRFLAQWPPGSDAHESYFERITLGPKFRTEDAFQHQE